MASRSTTPAAPILPLLADEISHAAFELRYMICFMLILTAADFWWAMRENDYKKSMAIARGDPEAAERYEFRISRAGRRTANKIVDYTTYLLVGAFLGYAVLEPLSVTNHVVTAAIGIGFGCAFDISSIVGHVFASRGYRWSARKALSALIRFKMPEFENVIDEVIVKENDTKTN